MLPTPESDTTLMPVLDLNRLQALIEDGAKFVGLALDEDNEDDQSLPRIKKWVEQLKSEGIGA